VRAVVLLFALLALAGCGNASERKAAVATSDRGRQPDSAPAPQRRAPHPARPETGLRAIRAAVEEHAVVSERLTEIAGDLTGFGPTVYCWDAAGWRLAERVTNRELPPEERGSFAGLADLFAADIHLAPDICEVLEALPERAGDDIAVAAALSVFAHETRHLSPAGSSEAAAECAGLQKIPEAAAALGLDEQEGSRLARIAWEEVYPGLPSEYRSPECRSGGTLDREPETPEFP